MDVKQRQMASLTDGLPSKSEKMRVVARAGYERAEIARFLGSRYQFVRNVLVHEATQEAKRAEAASVKPAAVADNLSSTTSSKVRLGPDGRIVIPAEFRDA